MRIVFLGTAGYHPNRKRLTSCVMLPDLGIVFDAGDGFSQIREHLKTQELHVFLSHYHWDHVIGLTALTDIVWQKKFTALHIYGRSPISAVHTLFKEPHFPIRLKQHGFPVTLDEWRPGKEWSIGDIRIRARLFPHKSGGSLAFRLEHCGKTIVYLTDTTVTLDAASFVEGADLLICECNFPNAMKELAIRTTHSYPRLVAKLAKAAGVKRLVLFHIAPLLEKPGMLSREAKNIFHSSVLLAEDEMELEI
ncbi:MAG: hypothetical protein A2806_02065 [Candidatus Terrybacteria bacterium RIFCSPHIGHO2_01_FULL_48_17]|uniref:Metallo-beta-lactamase domain-containing protein n=1 Tax=Candidatus Terrybacteria bacterium RIFCSPHIGHO2_01_FULL_48_17 TaxID=1802362 RepID=A0A1G2PHR7_9BACT|nr:MAG: hypothetical protein A2806_02065 [Candidatus Terrybacteria bacterium RIFCSPHIGHO2_01_FULL_48_17]OHA53539.1 MAG: hypothetical protein A3A30_00020 [Candidatus Terrybacteria bacterium RIFCSPLOWO2_01_FULL_48_14]